ncbi:MAG: alpha-L-fucosidase [Bryobacteraceae bacterium]
MIDNVSRRRFLAGGALAISGLASAKAAPPPPAPPPPAPYGALPSGRQVRWSEMEFYNFLHFGMNTFTGREWGYGNDSPSLFNPTDFDANAIMEALKNGGSTGAILTCKHHDGFCLWPTKTTGYSIKRSPYKNGKGDIVREISEAAHRYGLKFGVYCSPWDRHEASYGTPQYVQLYRQQIHELLTWYGPVFEIWHDGANGGTGWYGGAGGKRIIDKHTYYHWPEIWALERKLQPNAVIFSDVGPDIRWIGNEKGIAGETCWATYTPRSADGGTPVPGDVDQHEASTGTRNGKFWMPGECDVSIRPGWFWHAKQNSEVKSPGDLLKLFYESTGRGASFLLNVPPDRRGRIDPADAESLRGFARLRRSIFSRNLAAHARITASNVRGNPYRAENMTDGKRETYWATGDAHKTPHAIFDFDRPVAFNIVRLREAIHLGQRIGAFAVDVWENGNWSPFGQGASIGACRILRREQLIRTNRVRLAITKSLVCPALAEFALFAERG